tara:strand:- start:7833 stop:8174 length:342 start_codon:yes stop_codon:yes gene_type:complete
MNKTGLIELLLGKHTKLNYRQVDDLVRETLEFLSNQLANERRIEIRGFGSFSLHYRAPRTGRNPKTGELVQLEERYVPYFKPGKDMKELVNKSLNQGLPIIKGDESEDSDVLS